ncbi:MAG: hypothetical protein GY703_02090, partial [Gammaproteobacteria bacterium]|nr:hypothetical protein [Gammaproteobacteria bacterium]
MNRDAWDSSNKKWLSERKEVWKRYEVNLRYTKLFDRSDLKYIKDYFLFGIEPKDEDGNYYDENVTLPLIIKACCYPSCSEEDWFMLRDDVLENSFQPKTDVTRSYSMLFENGRHCDYSVENGLYDGLFLGDEQKIIGFFCGKPGEPEVINLENTDYLRYCFGEGLFLS